MKTPNARLLLVPLTAISLLSVVVSPAHAQAAPCRFQLGFADLAGLLGQQAGACREDQHPTPAGDAEQRTTTGLMVWRRADNWTAFTDGYRTWINGPQGLQDRLNTERLAWEPDYVAPPAPPPAPPTPAVAGTDLGLPVRGTTIGLTALAFGQTGGGAPGAREVKVTVKVESGTNGQGVGQYRYWDFRLRDAQGVEYRPNAYLAAVRPGALSDGTLTRGQFVVGDLYFEVPDAGQGYGLHYYPQGWSNPPHAVNRWLGAAA